MALFAAECGVSFASVVAFAVLFHAPQNQWLWCGLTGMASWSTYWLLTQRGFSPAMASLAASIVLALLARILAVARRCPSTIYLTGGIFPLVPGAGLYYTVYYFILGDSALSVRNGVETIKVAAAIAVGIVLVLALPAGAFRLFQRKAPK